MGRKGIFYLLLFAMCIVFFATNMKGYNFEYRNVTSKVNITNSYPSISAISMGPYIDLSAGTTKSVTCNVSAYDFNGYSDIVSVNATLWDNSTSTYNAVDNVLNHYTNSSCSNITSSGFYANYTCSFDIVFYANNGTWICNASIIDQANFTNYFSNSSIINPLYALNITPIIDYGNMILGATSNNITANITNFGNMPINISVRGYGGTNPVTGEGYAMICESGNITIENERFSANPLDDWNAKIPLNSTLKNITGLTVPKSTGGTSWNTTYWQLYVNQTNNPWGLCNGTVEFTAVMG